MSIEPAVTKKGVRFSHWFCTGSPLERTDLRRFSQATKRVVESEYVWGCDNVDQSWCDRVVVPLDLGCVGASERLQFELLVGSLRQVCGTLTNSDERRLEWR